MPDIPRHDVELSGCTPEPLMAYLKALGIFRLISEQPDQGARGWWRGDVFWLRSTLDRDALVKFFLQEYKPTPIVVPWSGGDFFAVNWNPKQSKHKKTPTASSVVESLLTTSSERFQQYRDALVSCKEAMAACGMDTSHTSQKDALKRRKKEFEKIKWKFIERLRATCPVDALEWIDAASVTGVEAFAPLLGSGGGSDGNTHFSDNFMQNLWDVLPDFDDQRDFKGPRDDAACIAGLRTVMFGEPGTFRVGKRTSSLFDSGAVGGPNATQGMNRDSLSNPWDVILGIEGTLCFAAAAVKRLGSNATVAAAFPFQFSASSTIRDGLAEKESLGREVWLPLWCRPGTIGEIRSLLAEGRAEVAGRTTVRRAANGVDMARAIATLGTDRGIRAFHRYAILKGRVGGDNYNTAASLGRFAVQERPEADLLREIDDWLRGFRRACSGDNVPPRFGSALRRIDSAVFEFCKYGGVTRFQNILVMLGQAARELANAERFREDKKIKPLAELSTAWIEAASDGALEFRVALALAGVRYEPDRPDEQPKIGPFRANLESVDWRKVCRGWAEKDRAVVWNAADLATNLANVLQRRVMDGARAGCKRLPLASCWSVPLNTIAAFVSGNLDDQRIEDLIWGLMLVDSRRGGRQLTVKTSNVTEASPLPRDYALLKLLFLPHPLLVNRHDGKVRWQFAKNGESGIAIRSEPRILPLLRAGRVGEACQIAAQRLRVSGLLPMPGPLPTGVMRDDHWAERTIDHRAAQRFAAALLIPISSTSVDRLIHLVCRDVSATNEALTTS